MPNTIFRSIMNPPYKIKAKYVLMVRIKARTPETTSSIILSQRKKDDARFRSFTPAKVEPNSMGSARNSRYKYTIITSLVSPPLRKKRRQQDTATGTSQKAKLIYISFRSSLLRPAARVNRAARIIKPAAGIASSNGFNYNSGAKFESIFKGLLFKKNIQFT